MRLPPRLVLALLLLAAIAPWLTQAQQPGPTLTYIPGSSAKVYQINGDCDWPEWDATIAKPHPTCAPTFSQTAANADILGDDVGSSFESNGQLIMTFGDTIGADSTYSPAWTSVYNPYLWQAHDPIGYSTTRRAEDGLRIDFTPMDGHAQEVLPTNQPDGNPVSMGADDVPDGGINLNGQIYLSVKTGTTTDSSGNHSQNSDYNVLVKYDEAAQTFTSGRTISSSPDGHFVTSAFYQPSDDDWDRDHFGSKRDVVIFGVGLYRGSNIYLSTIPADHFESGVDSHGNSATRYLSGWDHGWPKWSQHESDAVPIVTDIDPANPTVGNISAFYSRELGLWLMTFDSFNKAQPTTNGAYLTYALHPWGPWAKPQQIFNSCRDHALGTFMRYHYATAALNTCPAAMPPGNTATSGSSGPAGPTIGNQTKNDPQTTRGGEYAPLMIERFTEVEDNKLKIFYTLSTWNPYAVVLMESDFNIDREWPHDWDR